MSKELDAQIAKDRQERRRQFQAQEALRAKFFESSNAVLQKDVELKMRLLEVERASRAAVARKQAKQIKAAEKRRALLRRAIGRTGGEKYRPQAQNTLQFRVQIDQYFSEAGLKVNIPTKVKLVIKYFNRQQELWPVLNAKYKTTHTSAADTDSTNGTADTADTANTTDNAEVVPDMVNRTTVTVGQRLAVFWPDDESPGADGDWYLGTLALQHPTKPNCWVVGYDDGDIEIEDLGSVKWSLETEQTRPMRYYCSVNSLNT